MKQSDNRIHVQDAATPSTNHDVVVVERELVECTDPVELARKVKLAFKKMPGEAALACFAKLITEDLPHPLKVAVWDAVRYSHIWWGVDEVLKGDVMNNPLVQQAFADAVPMRRFRVANRLPGWKFTLMTVDFWIGIQCDLSPYSNLQLLIHYITALADVAGEKAVQEMAADRESGELMRTFADVHGNNLLWYLTYRDDQNAQGGFACPCIERELLWLGVDPNHRNNLGLCWNDVRRHLIRPEV